MSVCVFFLFSLVRHLPAVGPSLCDNVVRWLLDLCTRRRDHEPVDVGRKALLKKLFSFHIFSLTLSPLSNCNRLEPLFSVHRYYCFDLIRNHHLQIIDEAKPQSQFILDPEKREVSDCSHHGVLPLAVMASWKEVLCSPLLLSSRSYAIVMTVISCNSLRYETFGSFAKYLGLFSNWQSE